MIALLVSAVSRAAEWFRSWSRDQAVAPWVPTEAAGEVETLAEQLELMALERDEARDRALARRAQVAELRALLGIAQAELTRLCEADAEWMIRELRARERDWQRDRDQLAACREQITALEESLGACSRANEDGARELEQCRSDLAACHEQIEGGEVEEAAMALLSEDRILRIAELSRANEELSQELVRTRCALTDQAPYFQGLLGQETAKCANLAEELAGREEELEQCRRALAEHQEMLKVEMASCAELAKRADETEDRLAESARDQRSLEDELARARTALVELCRGLGTAGQIGASEAELAQAALGAARAWGERVGKLRGAAITVVRRLEDLATRGEYVDPNAVEAQANLLRSALAADAREHRTRVGDTEPGVALAPPPSPSPVPAVLPLPPPPVTPKPSLAASAAALMNSVRRSNAARAEVDQESGENGLDCTPSATCGTCEHLHWPIRLGGWSWCRSPHRQVLETQTCKYWKASRDELPSEQCQPSSGGETQAGQVSSFPSIEKKASKLEALEDVTTEHCSENGLKAIKVAKVGLEPSIQESGENGLECNRLQESLCGNCASTELGAPPGGSGKVDR